MGKLKEMALVNALLGPAREPRKREPFNTPPAKFTYALANYTVEIRSGGWYVAKSVPTFTGDKPAWSGPFETIEAACLAIGRRLATEIADRHTRSVEAHKIKRDDPLYGLKKTTRLRQTGKAKGSVA
jgi:hypothetical protein